MGIANRLAALLRDTRGNSLPIFAASLIPLLAIVGGGVDAARGYLTKVQLQNACDAGVLAGRRAMATSGDYGDDEKETALRMFRANFDADIVDATDINFDTVAGTEGDVSGTASTEIPTVLMQLFGYYDMAFSVDCSAELQMTNADVMFVLDVTGSMAGARIVALRDAVRAFHLTIASSITDDDVRVRYGFVPYSMTVNARRLLEDGDMPMDFIADTASYQSRLAVFNQERTVDGRRVFEFSRWNYAQTMIDVSDFKTFEPTRFVTGVNSGSWEETWSGWRYRVGGYTPEAGQYDIRELAQMTGTSGLQTRDLTWEGCIEERATVVDEDMDPVPDGAEDLDINAAPDSDATRWKPYFPQGVFFRENVRANDARRPFLTTNNYCPAQMRLFEDVDLTAEGVPDWLNDYLDDLTPIGGTYHDIGMIWGGRLASPDGIFADVVNNEPDLPVDRHLIFMTDDEIAPEIDYYSAYGMERYDNRVAPRGTGRAGLAAFHTARFAAACQAIKNEGYIVWVVSFGDAELTDEMNDCASGDNRALSPETEEELRQAFSFIASQVADLRLNE